MVFQENKTIHLHYITGTYLFLFIFLIMIFKILLIAAVALGLALAIKAKDKRSLTITTGLALGVLLVFTPISYLKTSGITIYTIFAFTAFIYGLIKKNFEPNERVVISIITLPVFVYWLFALFHFPGLNILKYLMFFPVAGFIIAAFKNKNLKSELGFLLIFAVDAITLIVH